MDSPKDRGNDPKRKPVYTDDELLNKFNALHKKITSDKGTNFNGFSDDPSSRNTGWFFSGK